MENFKSFEQFIKENYSVENFNSLSIEQLSEEELNESLKSLLIGGLISLMTVGGVTAQTKNYTETINKETVDKFFGGKKIKIDRTREYKFDLNDSMTKDKADKMISKLLSKGWTLESSALDTIYSEVIKKNPESEIKAISLKFSDKAFFESGKFEVTEEMKSDIENAISDVTESGGQILKIDIKSSTDKQRVSDRLNNTLKSLGFESGNKGLSQARSANISDFLEEKGISDTIIDITNLVEEGKNEIDQDARYVTVDFIFLEIPSAPTSVDTKEEIKYVVKITKSEEVDINKDSNTKYKAKKKYSKVKKQKTRGALKCPTF